MNEQRGKPAHRRNRMAGFILPRGYLIICEHWRIECFYRTIEKVNEFQRRYEQGEISSTDIDDVEDVLGVSVSELPNLEPFIYWQMKNPYVSKYALEFLLHINRVSIGDYLTFSPRTVYELVDVNEPQEINDLRNLHTKDRFNPNLLDHFNQLYYRKRTWCELLLSNISFEEYIQTLFILFGSNVKHNDCQ